VFLSTHYHFHEYESVPLWPKLWPPYPHLVAVDNWGAPLCAASPSITTIACDTMPRSLIRRPYARRACALWHTKRRGTVCSNMLLPVSKYPALPVHPQAPCSRCCWFMHRMLCAAGARAESVLTPSFSLEQVDMSWPSLLDAVSNVARA
jgi:hypothetical protein